MKIRLSMAATFALAITLSIAQGIGALERFDIVTTQELEELFAGRAAGTSDFLLVNTLDDIIFKDRCIPGSIHVPWSQVSTFSERLGADKQRLIITYCMGYRCVFSYKTAVAIKALGYTNIKIYNGGIKDWIKSGHTIETVQGLPDYAVPWVTTDERYALAGRSTGGAGQKVSAPVTILDLRNENLLVGESADTGRLVNLKVSCPVVYAFLDDLQRPETRGKIPKTTPVVTITETGNRDQFAIRYLSRFGFTNIMGLRYGMRGWIKAGYPTSARQE